MRRLEFGFCVAGDHPSLAGHFPGNPVVPGVLLLDHVLQALHSLDGRELIELKRAKFTSALLPGESACGTFDIDGARFTFRVSARRGDVMVGVAEGGGTVAAETTV